MVCILLIVVSSILFSKSCMRGAPPFDTLETRLTGVVQRSIYLDMGERKQPTDPTHDRTVSVHENAAVNLVSLLTTAHASKNLFLYLRIHVTFFQVVLLLPSTKH